MAGHRGVHDLPMHRNFLFEGIDASGLSSRKGQDLPPSAGKVVAACTPPCQRPLLVSDLASATFRASRA